MQAGKEECLGLCHVRPMFCDLDKMRNYSVERSVSSNSSHEQQPDDYSTSFPATEPTEQPPTRPKSEPAEKLAVKTTTGKEIVVFVSKTWRVATLKAILSSTTGVKVTVDQFPEDIKVRRSIRWEFRQRIWCYGVVMLRCWMTPL